MGMTVKRRKDQAVPRVFVHKVADIPGGVSVDTSELGGDFLFEGTPLSAPYNGICYVVKQAVVTAKVEASDTVVKVKKGHHFTVGDALLLKVGGKAAKITKIFTGQKDFDTFTLSFAIGEIPARSVLAQAEDVTTTDDAELVDVPLPLSLSGTGRPIVKGDNLDTDAWLIGTTHGATLNPDVEKLLKGIVNY